MADPVGDFLSAAEFFGDSMLIEFVRESKVGPPELITLHHRQYDGVSAYTEILKRTADLQPALFPRAANRWSSPPPLAKQLLSLLRMFLEIPYPSLSWSLRNPAYEPARFWNQPHPAKASVELSPGDLRKIRDRAGDAGLNSYLLHRLHQAASRFLVDPAAPGVWMMPVSLHQDFGFHKAPRNESSFIDVTHSNRASPAELRAQIEARLRRGEHWGKYLGIRLGHRLGPWMMNAVMRSSPRLFNRMGYLTNPGSWGTAADTSRTRAILTYPPVTRFQPIAACILTWCGETRLTLRLHASLSEDPAIARKLLQDWLDGLFSA